MKGLVLLGVVLSLLVFMPRILKKADPSLYARVMGTNGGANGQAVDGRASTGGAGRGGDVASGNQPDAAHEGGRPAGDGSAGGSPSGTAAGNTVVDSASAARVTSPRSSPSKRVVGVRDAGGRKPVSGGGSVDVAPSVKRLQAGLKKLWARLKQERAAREAAEAELYEALRAVQLSQQLARLRAGDEAKKYNVPEWNAPYCHKAKLKKGDQARYVKIGVGLVFPRGKEDPPELGPLVGKILLHSLHKRKLPIMRLYRESLEHCKLLSDLLPPSERDAKAPEDLRVGSLGLDSTLQCTYAVGKTGELLLDLRLYSVPRGKLLFEARGGGRDYEAVLMKAAKTIAGLPRDKLKEVR